MEQINNEKVYTKEEQRYLLLKAGFTFHRKRPNLLEFPLNTYSDDRFLVVLLVDHNNPTNANIVMHFRSGPAIISEGRLLANHNDLHSTAVVKYLEIKEQLPFLVIHTEY